jgi:hypothetical protein
VAVAVAAADAVTKLLLKNSETHALPRRCAAVHFFARCSSKFRQERDRSGEDEDYERGDGANPDRDPRPGPAPEPRLPLVVHRSDFGPLGAVCVGCRPFSHQNA